MHITLIYPRWERIPAFMPDSYRFLYSKFANIATPGIPLLAALTPPEHDVQVINEFYEDIDDQVTTDLVAISFFTPQASRAYALAQRFREKGIYTVAGGIHPSVLPAEAGQYFDTVITGEAETVWPQFLKDLAMKKALPVYRGSPVTRLTVRPDRSVFDKYEQSFIQPVQTSRGCYISHCETCVIPEVYGKQIRLKNLDVLRDEVAGIRDKVICLMDDHVIWGQSSHARLLFETLAPLQKFLFISGAPATLTGNPEFLKLAKQAGCHTAYVSLGFDPDTSQGLYRHYDKLVRQLLLIKQAGIVPILCVFLGLDSDDTQVFDQTLRFCQDAEVEAVDYAILCPFPGTKLFARLNAEQRLLHTDWSRYNYFHPVFKPLKMSVDELQAGFQRVWSDQFTRYPSLDHNSPFFQDIIRQVHPHISPLPVRVSYF